MIANLPDGRVIAINRDNGEIVWDKQVAKANEFGSKERFLTAPITAEGKVIVANGAGDAQTRGWLAALDVKTGNELWRWYVVPKPGDPGSETWKDKTQRLEDRRRRPLADRLLRSRDKAHDLGHRQSGSDLRSAGAAGRQSLHQLRGRARHRDRQARLVFPVHAERFVGLRRDRHPHAVRHHDQRREPQGRRPLRAQRLLLHARSHQRQLHQERAIRQRPELDQGHRSQDRQAARIRSEARRAAYTIPKRARCAATG